MNNPMIIIYSYNILLYPGYIDGIKSLINGGSNGKINHFPWLSMGYLMYPHKFATKNASTRLQFFGAQNDLSSRGS